MAAKDHMSTDINGKLVAIKKIEKAFEHKIFTKRTLRELKILRLLKHENVEIKFNKNFFFNILKGNGIEHYTFAKI